MNAKEYLSQAMVLDKIIASKLEQLESLRSLATKVCSNAGQERVSGGSHGKQSMEHAVIKVVDLSDEINEDIEKLVQLRRGIVETINQVSDLNYQLLLELRYVRGKSWDEIGVDLGYDRSWVFRVHGRALKEIEGIMKEATKSD